MNSELHFSPHRVSFFRLRHPSQTSIVSLAWDPRENNSIAFSDAKGGIGIVEKITPAEDPVKEVKVITT